MTRILPLVLFALAGCAAAPPRPVGDLSPGVVIPDPEAGGDVALSAWADELERRYVRQVEVLGVVWQPERSSPDLEECDSYGSGGDSMLFTGIALAGWAWQHEATGGARGEERVLAALGGLRLLTSAAGRGVLARCALPAERASEFASRAAAQGQPFVGASPDGSVLWYTRGTKDQLTGLLFGLAVAWGLEGPLGARVRPVVREVVEDVLGHLRRHDWKIRDADGRNDTSADGVDGLLKLSAWALGRAVGIPGAEGRYDDEFARFAATYSVLGIADRFNNLDGYYAHNLRALRSFSVWLLEPDPSRRAVMVRYAAEHWRRWTVDHGNAWLSWLFVAMSGADDDGEGLRALHELRLKPTRFADSPVAGRWGSPSPAAVLAGDASPWALPVYLRKPTAYFVWQKEPWDEGEPGGPTTGDTCGIDFLAPYWLGRTLELAR